MIFKKLLIGLKSIYILFKRYFSNQAIISSSIGSVRGLTTFTKFPSSSIRYFWKFQLTLLSSNPFLSCTK